MKFRKRIFVAVVLTGTVLAAWAFWLEPASITVSEHLERIENWPPACDGLRVAVLADLHVGSPFNDLARLADIVALTNTTSPDLILLAGDYVIQDVIGGTFVSPEATALELSQLRAPLGTYAVLGNHDWILGAERVATALSSAGIKVLEDRNTRVGHGECVFTLAGISDLWEGPHDIAKALGGRDPELAVLAFTHNPDLIPELPAGVTFFVAGHTHGGQVSFPWLGRLIVPSQFGERYAAGSITEGEQRAFVSTGIGTSIFAVRFRVPPEVTVLELRSGDAR